MNGDMSFIQPILKYYTVKSFSLLFNKKDELNVDVRTHTQTHTHSIQSSIQYE